jgi:hypothetical protein
MDTQRVVLIVAAIALFFGTFFFVKFIAMDEAAHVKKQLEASNSSAPSNPAPPPGPRPPSGPPKNADLTAPPAIKTYIATYRVSGTASNVEVRYRGVGGAEQTARPASLPWHHSILTKTGERLALSVSNQSGGVVEADIFLTDPPAGAAMIDSSMPPPLGAKPWKHEAGLSSTVSCDGTVGEKKKEEEEK